MRTIGVLIAAGAIAAAAAAAGPWPGLAPSVQGPAGIRYTTTQGSGETLLKAMKGNRAIASARVAGSFGIPAVTTFGEAGGLSPDGKLLVLAQPPDYDGVRPDSTFVVLSAPRLATVAKITLPGEFGFDALSPNRRYLYLLQHKETGDQTRYAVRAYDLQARRLLPGAIVDKRNVDEQMRGMPIARAATARGDWVFTLYAEDPETKTTFVHALNAAGRYAFCIDLPAWPTGVDLWTAKLKVGPGVLLVQSRRGTTIARIDTRSMKVL